MSVNKCKFTFKKQEHGWDEGSVYILLYVELNYKKIWVLIVNSAQLNLN